MTFATEVSTSDLTPNLTPVLARDAKARRVAVLKTERLVLRAPSHADVPAMVAARRFSRSSLMAH
jgi:hypothetical protein